MNRAERRRAERQAERDTSSNMARMRANAERLRNQGGSGANAQQGVGDFEGIPMGVPFNLGDGQVLPPFNPTQQCNLMRLEVNGTSFFILNLAGPYGGGIYYLPINQFAKLIEQGTKELEIAKAAVKGLTVVSSEAEMHEIAERAEKMASGLIVPGQ